MNNLKNPLIRVVATYAFRTRCFAMVGNGRCVGRVKFDLSAHSGLCAAGLCNRCLQGHVILFPEGEVGVKRWFDKNYLQLEEVVSRVDGHEGFGK